MGQEDLVIIRDAGTERSGFEKKVFGPIVEIAFL
jgi:hypothetical protein